MTLLSLEFFLFLTLSGLAYYLSPLRMRVYVLSVLSLLFYLLLGIVSFVCIFAVTLISFGFALWIERREKGGSEILLFVSVLLVLIIWLGVRGAVGLSITAFPIGISFYSLRIISYLADVRRGSIAAERNLFKYILYTSFFPIAFLGPVVNYKDVNSTLLYPSRASWDNISGGVLRILFGVFKKLVVADALIDPVRKMISDTDRFFGAHVIILIVTYSVEIYFDFSGGIDIALGAAQIFGVSLSENFNKPFSSKTIAEFWNRWHITLGEWFEHYVFYPISLSRPMQRASRYLRGKLGVKVGKRIPLYFATILTWLLTGLWHGGEGHFTAWGLINGILVILSSETSKVIKGICDRHRMIDFFRRKVSFLASVRVFFIIGAVRLLDVYEDMLLTFKMIGSIFTRPESYIGIVDTIGNLMPLSSLIPIFLGIATVFFVSKFGIRAQKICRYPYAFALCVVALISTSLLFGVYGYGFDASDFIYSQF